jgi:hypothetical protein
MSMSPYIIVPWVCGIAAAGGMLFWSRSSMDRGTQLAVTLSNVVSAGLSAYFASAVLLLALVPGPGTGGPVQYWAGSDKAMEIFHFRGSLFFVGATLFFWASIQAIVTGLSLFTKNRRLILCSMIALFGVVLALIAGFATLHKWMPTV